jgi:hypothetical protein
MNDGVKILLERMKTHPEEFVSEHGSSKWGSLIVAYKEHLDPEDRQAITEGMKIVLQQRFTERVMEELINPNKNTLKITENTIWNGASATISSASYYPTTVIPPV